MKVLPLSARLQKYLIKRGLEKKYQKQIGLLSKDLRHPSLKVERLEPKHAGVYSFRIDRQYRVIFSFIPEEKAIEVLDITDHYQ